LVVWAVVIPTRYTAGVRDRGSASFVAKTCGFGFVLSRLNQSAILQKRYNQFAEASLMSEWVVEFLDESVEALLDALPEDIQASFLRIAELIRSKGLEQVREPYVKHLDGPIWEMRLKGRGGIARAAYVTAIGKRVVAVHVFGKKTEKTPRREIEIALRRAKEVR